MPPQQPNPVPTTPASPPQSFTPSTPPKHHHSYWLLIAAGVAIAILTYLGISQVTSAPVSIFALFTNPEMGGYALFLLPAVVVSLILILISWRWGRNIYRKENRPVQGFFFGTSLYLLLVFLALGITNVLLVGYAHTVADDVSFAVGLIFSIFFITSIQILYVGLLICMGLLIYSTRSSPEEPSQAPSPLAIQFRYAVMGVMIIFALYIFGLAAPIATATHQQWLCNLVYSSRAKADCLLNTSAIAASENAAQNSGNSGTFTIVKTDYKQIKDLHEVGGKLAYAFENNDGTSGVAYDGQVVSGAYQKVGILPIAEVGGKLAYEAYKGDKEIIVWDGQEFGTSYNRASQPTDIGGKLAFVAEIGKKYFVVYDGKEYGREADGAGRPTSIQGKLAYAADTNINGGQYVVFDGKQVGGRYGRVEWIKDEDGHLVFEGVNGNGTLLVVDGKEYGFGYGQIQNHVLIDGKLAFSAQKDGKTVIVYEGTEIGTGSSYEAGPYNIKGQLAYIAANPDGTSQLMVGGQAVGPVMSGSVRNVDVSKGGRVVVQIDDGSKQCRGVVHGPIYLDGEKVYEGCSSNPFGFFGEKLLFWTQEGGDKALWYDGKKIGQGFYGYNYFAVVDGKLAIAAFASAGQGVQYSLLLEQ